MVTVMTMVVIILHQQEGIGTSLTNDVIKLTCHNLKEEKWKVLKDRHKMKYLQFPSVQTRRACIG